MRALDAPVRATVKPIRKKPAETSSSSSARPGTKSCPSCSRELELEAKFCGSCGHQIAQPASKATPPTSQPARRAKPTRKRERTRTSQPRGAALRAAAQRASGLTDRVSWKALAVVLGLVVIAVFTLQFASESKAGDRETHEELAASFRELWSRSSPQLLANECHPTWQRKLEGEVKRAALNHGWDTWPPLGEGEVRGNERFAEADFAIGLDHGRLRVSWEADDERWFLRDVHFPAPKFDDTSSRFREAWNTESVAEVAKLMRPDRVERFERSLTQMIESRGVASDWPHIKNMTGPDYHSDDVVRVTMGLDTGETMRVSFVVLEGDWHLQAIQPPR